MKLRKFWELKGIAPSLKCSMATVSQAQLESLFHINLLNLSLELLYQAIRYILWMIHTTYLHNLRIFTCEPTQQFNT